MSTNNKVFQVLVVPTTTATPTLIAKDQTLDDLTVGQMGVFNSRTNLSIDVADLANIPENFYMAVKQASGKIDISAGQEIQGKNIRALSYQEAKEYTPFKAEIAGGFMAELKPNKEYTLRFEVKSTEILQRQGTVQYTFAIAAETGDEPNIKTFLKEVLVQSKGSISTDNMFTFVIMDDATPLDTAAKIDAYAGDGTSIKFVLTGSETFTNEYYDINTRFQNLRQTTVEVAFVDGYLEAGATYTVTEQGNPAMGTGYNIKQLEYFAGGWNGRPGPYRQSGNIGLALPGFQYRADENKQYDVFSIYYANHSNAGWGDYWNDIETIIAVEEETADGEVLVDALKAFFAEVVKRFNVDFTLINA